jgi:hypothetical protein
MSATPKPLVLIILDGFGHSDNPEANAIMAANTPVYDHLRATCPHGLISGSGMDVGLPDGQMGNSEVGHMNLGAGRVVYQDFTRVTKAIRDGEFFDNPVITAAVDKAVTAGKAVHILGLLSDGGVHSHQDHLVAMAELAARRGAEVHKDHGVAVFDFHWCTDAGGLDEFVALVTGIGGLQAFHGSAGVELTLAFDDQVVGLLDAVPAVVAVHGEVAAAEAGDTALAELGEGGIEQLDGRLGTFRRGVAAVEKGVQVDALGTTLGGQLGHGHQMILMAVHAAVGQ